MSHAQHDHAECWDEEEDPRVRYWAVIYGDNNPYRATGTVMDFYPNEEARHRASLVRQGATIYGTFNTPGATRMVVRHALKTLCAARRRRQ